MPGDEQGNERERSHEELWKSQEDEALKITTQDVCVQARKYERENVLVYWVMWGLTPLLVAAYLHELMRVHEPLIAAGLTWVLAVICCFAALALLWNRPNRKARAETCRGFLRREFEGKRRTFLWARRFILLIIPGIVCSWWGGGPLLRAKEMGVQSAWVLRPLGGPAFLVFMGMILGFVWFAFWKEGRKADRELEKLAAEK